MRFLPILVVSIALLGVVGLMSGDIERAKQVVLRVVITVVVMVGLVALFAIVTDRAL